MQQLNMDKVIIVVDIELSCKNWKNCDLLAIGIVAMQNYKLLDSKLICCYRDSTEPSYFEEDNEFWEKNKDTLAKLKYKGKRNKKNMYIDALIELIMFRNKYENNCVYVSDNPTLDFGYLNYLMIKYRMPSFEFPYLINGSWQNIIDLNSVLEIIYAVKKCDKKLFLLLRQLKVDKVIYKQISKLFIDKHNPLSDAHKVALIYNACINSL